MDQFLTSGEAAKRLDMTPDGIRAAERRGAIKALKTEGGVRLFQQAEIENFRQVRKARKQQHA